MLRGEILEEERLELDGLASEKNFVDCFRTYKSTSFSIDGRRPSVVAPTLRECSQK